MGAFISQALRRRIIPSQRMIYLRCPGCSYIVAEQVRGIGNNPFYLRLCPNCNTESKFALFPDEFSAAWELAEIIDHFYLRGAELIREAQAKLVRQVFDETGSECNIQDLEAAAWEIRTHYMDDDQWSDLLQQRFGLSSYEDAVMVLSTLQSYSTVPDENIAVVVLTSTLFEVLLGELMFGLACSRGMTSEQANEYLSKWNRKHLYFKLFKCWTKLKFADACHSIGLSEYWNQHQYLYNARNRFLHAGFGEMDNAYANRAHKFAQDSFPAFAKLHNSYALISLGNE